MDTMKSGFQHQPAKIAMIAGAWVTYIIMIVFNAISASGIDKNLFNSTQRELSDKYYNDFVPAGWTFSIWGFIYAWNALWLLYVTSTIFRKTEEGYVYIVSDLLPWYFFAAWYLNNIVNVIWLFVFDAESLIASVVVVAFVPFTLYICLFASYRQVDKRGVWLTENLPWDLWLTRAFVHNGLAIYATWTTIATILGLGIALIYPGGLDNTDVCTAMFAVLLVEVLIWFVLENFVLDHFCRYTLVTWVVVIMALIGSLVEHWGPEKRNSIFTAALVGLAMFLFLIRICLVVYRHCKHPLYKKHIFPSTIEGKTNGTFNMT
ncbi:Hypp7175 [Branchiostoma lanceolatum]|uniref:Hypp7175 protein n=1 Tax=Branchiostoma lanceolatum TaxID=7740 RepID=A0A8K0E7E4_BRALA|nr:Hypp7175 [Branchiostoma lanceolatum]